MTTAAQAALCEQTRGQIEAIVWDMADSLDPVAKQNLFLALANKAAQERYAIAAAKHEQSEPVDLELV